MRRSHGPASTAVAHVSISMSAWATGGDSLPTTAATNCSSLGAEVFGQRPYDEVRIDEIAERAGVSRALMYHYFPDKRAFFAAVVRAEDEKLFEATNTPPQPGRAPLRAAAGRRARLRASTTRPTRTARGRRTWAWGAPTRCCAASTTSTTTDRPTASSPESTDAFGEPLDAKLERDLRVLVYGWLAFTFEMCRQRIIDPSIDAGHVADSCAHALLDAVARMPGLPTLGVTPAALETWLSAGRQRGAESQGCRWAGARWLDGPSRRTRSTPWRSSAR